MSGYYAGFLVGSVLAPKLVARVGHVRVFAALASLASSAILVHVLWIDPAGWTVIRLVSGFCYAGLYVVVESWLNDQASNQTRGQLLSAYMVVVLGGAAGGQMPAQPRRPVGQQAVHPGLDPDLAGADPAAALDRPDAAVRDALPGRHPPALPGLADRRRGLFRHRDGARRLFRHGGGLRQRDRPLDPRHLGVHEPDAARRHAPAMADRPAVGCLGPAPGAHGRDLRSPPCSRCSPAWPPGARCSACSC